ARGRAISRPWLSGWQIQLERGCNGAKPARAPSLGLPNALGSEAERGAPLFQRLRHLAVQPEAPGQDEPHPWVQDIQCVAELDGAEIVRRRHLWTIELRVLDQVAVDALAVTDRRLEADRILDEVEQLSDALRRQ